MIKPEEAKESEKVIKGGFVASFLPQISHSFPFSQQFLADHSTPVPPLLYTNSVCIYKFYCVYIYIYM